jgi:DNA-binding NarL/FixJ family response regulator
MLTKREIEVLRLICNGDDNNEIAEKLYISRHTAKAHVKSILRKLGAKNRVRAAYLASELKLL